MAISSGGLTIDGTYVGTGSTNYTVIIDSSGTPDTFKWSNDGGQTFEATGVACSTSYIVLSDDLGLEIKFSATTGFDSGDRWNWTSVPAIANNIQSGKIIRNNDTNNLVYLNNNGVGLIEDIENPSTQSITSIAVGSDSVMTVHNKEVHIGLGGDVNLPPTWAGYIKNERLGTDIDEFVVTRAGITTLTALTFFDYLERADSSFDATNDWIFGATFGSSTMYRINGTSGAIDTDDVLFINICGIHYDDEDSKLYILDRINADNHVYKLHQMNNDFTIAYSHRFAFYDFWDVDWKIQFSDMITTDNKIWFAAYSPDRHSRCLIYNAPKPGANDNDLTLTPRSPKLEGEDVDGGWIEIDGGVAQAYEETQEPKTFIRSLIKCSSTVIGWYCHYNPNHHEAWYKGPRLRTTESQDYGVVAVNVVNKIHEDHGSFDIDDLASMATFNAGAGCQQSSNFTNHISPDLYINMVQCQDTSPSSLQVSDGAYIKLFPAIDTVTTSGTVQIQPAPGDAGTWYTALYAPSLIGHFIDGSNGASEPILFLGRQEVTPAIDSFSWWGEGYTLQALGQEPFAMAIADQATGTEKRVFWKVSFIYDGYQESVLTEHTYPSDGIAIDEDGVNANITLTLSRIGSLNKRLTGVSIYRSENADDTETKPNVFFRLVKAISFSDAGWDVSTDNDGNVNATYDFTDDTDPGASYDAITGIDELLTNPIVSYGLATEANSQLFVGQCAHPSIEDAKQYLFRSKPYKYDTFDWSKDFLRLPTIPTALATFGGRIYAFDESNTYRIEPNNFFVEDIFEGIGCTSQRSVLTTEYGMFFCSDHNIYMHTGSSPQIIGDAIIDDADNANYPWQHRDVTVDPVLAFDPFRTSLLVFFKAGDPQGTGFTRYSCWAYNLPRKRWDLLDLSQTHVPQCYVSGKNGESYIGTNYELIHYLANADTRRTWEYQTKLITLGADTQDKMFYKIRLVGSGTATYGMNGGAPTTSLTSEKIATNDKKAKAIQVKVVPVGNTGEVDSIGIIYRPLPVK
jgi:hypothetical protein